MESLAPAFVSTEELAKLIEAEPNLKILDVTPQLTPDDEDPVLAFHKSHIQG